MNKKLIDWATAPKGTMTSYGELRGELLGKIFVEHVNKHGYVVTSAFDHAYLRLAPADQQPWMVYEEGVTVIPDWAECSFRMCKSSNRLGRFFDYLTPKSHSERVNALTNGYVPTAYKLGKIQGKLFKDGWTDNPNEVSE
jgi:hypothetical protein